MITEVTCPKRSQNECPLFLDARKYESPDPTGNHIQAREWSIKRRRGAPAPPQEKLPPQVANCDLSHPRLPSWASPCEAEGQTGCSWEPELSQQGSKGLPPASLTLTAPWTLCKWGAHTTPLCPNPVLCLYNLLQRGVDLCNHPPPPPPAAPSCPKCPIGEIMMHMRKLRHRERKQLAQGHCHSAPFPSL